MLFRRLQNRYAELRARWLERELLAELRRGAQLADSPLARDVEAGLDALSSLS